MELWIVRHACAGHKEDWSGEDDERPLDPSGHEQAEALADLLAGDGPTRLVSSPTVRCTETLAPLAVRTGLPIERDDALRPGVGADTLRAIVDDDPPVGTVVCTHGETMQPLLDHLRQRGLVVDGDGAGDEHLLLKGTAWRLEGRPGALRLTPLAPVPRAECPWHL